MPNISERASALRPVVKKRVDTNGLRATAREIGISHTAVSNFVTGSTPQAQVLEKYEAWAERTGVLPDGRTDEETPEDAVREPRGSYGVDGFDYETAFRVVRLVGGKEGITEETRRDLQKAILNTYIDELKRDGIPAGPLYEMLGRVERGDV